MRFLVDEDVFECLKFMLDEWGHDAHHVKLRPDLISEEDSAILARAALEDRVVITFNTDDYEALHGTYQAEGKKHAGILCCRQYEGYLQFHHVLQHLRSLLLVESEASLHNHIRYLHTY
jgi:predicted nuclease of predicted toxin-antitoxin system